MRRTPWGSALLDVTAYTITADRYLSQPLLNDAPKLL